MRLSYTILFLTVFHIFIYPNVADIPKVYSIGGFVHDAENDSYLAAATVSLQPGDRHIQANENGFFSFNDLPVSNYMLTIRFIGYNDLNIPINLSKDTLMHLHLQSSSLLLSELTVTASNGYNDERLSALPVAEINRDYLLQNNSTNFVQTITSIAGISSMDIGAGFSKPVIRGLGFNRVAVVDKGVVQQNQQWGADHGLEIDQYDVDNVRVHKGPMSLFFGSDAIGGVIEIMPPVVPDEDMFWGDATLIGKSNNDLLGASVMASKKKGNLFFRGRATLQSYGDYRIPADTIEYLTWKMPVHDRRMKNTAGREYNLSFSTNYDNENFSSWLHISNINSKNGFYPGAHGIPSLYRLEPDESVRNIEMPFATSNHFKLIANIEWKLSNSNMMNLDLGYQNNHREEWSEFHTHNINEQPPAIDPDLELQFKLNTFSANLRFVEDGIRKWSKIIGASYEYQHNRVGGYSFLFPDFDRITVGAFWLNKYRLRERLTLTGGVRYDMGKLDGEELSNSFSNLSGSAGIDFIINTNNSLKLNIGSSFRYPAANELASDGMHHGAFRHERGNQDLKPEKGYQFDVDYQYQSDRLNIIFNPFVALFSNFIFLEPSGEWSDLPHAGQVYMYQQSEVFIAGGELMVEYLFNDNWKASSDLEYVYNINLNNDYPLPFSPPAAVTSDLTYSGEGRGAFSQYSFGVENRWVMDQNRIARNEEMTSGTSLWNLSAQAHWSLGGRRYITQLRADNVFNSSFLNHLSFYRRLNAPEPGRNVQFIVKVLF